MADNTPPGHGREYLLILGGIGALIILGLSLLLAVVLHYRG